MGINFRIERDTMVPSYCRHIVILDGGEEIEITEGSKPGRIQLRLKASNDPRCGNSLVIAPVVANTIEVYADPESSVVAAEERNK